MPIVNFVNVLLACQTWVKRHYGADGKKHSKRLEGHDQIKNLFKPKTVKAPVDSKSAASLTSYNVSITKSLDAYFQDSAC